MVRTVIKQPDKGAGVKPHIDDDEDHFDIGFEQFTLRPGLELEVHDDSTGRLLDHKVQFVSAHTGKDVLIAFQAVDPAGMIMEAGKRYRISGFSGKFDFAFSSKALKVDPAQSTVLLEAPVTVSIRFVRKHRRSGLALPASILWPGKSSAVQVTVKNLGLGGAAIASIEPLGAKGDSVTLRFQITFDNKKEDMNLVSVIRQISEPNESLMLNIGVEFVNASRNDKLLLHYYISTLSNEFNLI